MKRLFSLIICFCLLASVGGNAFAVEASASEEVGNGLKMSVGSFIKNYTGEESNSIKQVRTVATRQAETISYGEFFYDADSRALSFDVIINDGETDYPLLVDGCLYNSWKQGYGINSVVGKMTTDNESFEVLTFEIYNDKDVSLLNETFVPGSEQGEILKFYLKKGESLYLFETPIPEVLKNISIPDIPANRCTESKVDGFWFQDIVPPQMGVVEKTASGSEIGIRSTEDQEEDTLEATWTISGVPYIYYADVIMYYHFSDVEDNAGDWRLEFSIDDAYCKVNGVRNELTGLRISNIDMRMVTGPYTKMLNATPGFSLIDSSSVGGNPTRIRGFLSVCESISGNVAVSLATTAINWLMDASQESNTVDRTGIYLPNFADDAQGRTFGYNIPSRYFMQYAGHYVAFDLRTRSSSFGASNATGGIKTGICEVEFDYYVGETVRHYSEFTDVRGTYRCTLA